MALSFSKLQYFIRIVEYGSLTRAAVALDVAQPALSRVLRDLELEMGCTLCERNGRGLSLTDAGRHFLTGARGILAELEAAECEASAACGVPLSVATLGVEPILCGVLSVPVARYFLRRRPRHLLKIVETRMPRSDSASVSGVLPDLVVGCGEHLPETSLLHRDRLCMIGRAELFDAGACGVPLVLSSKPDTIRLRYEAGLCRDTLPGKVIVETTSLALSVSLIESGSAAAIVPSIALPSFGNDMRVLPLKGALAEIEIGAMMPPQAEESARSRLLMEALRSTSFARLPPAAIATASRPALQ